MRKATKKERSKRKLKWLQIEILVVFAVIIMVVIFSLDYVILENSKRAMERNASNLIAANSRQIQLNINSYLERMETIPTLLFSDEGYYLYDAIDSGVEEYDKIKSEEALQDRIADIGMMENYSDFAVVYSNDHTVGWVSHGTEDMFPDGGMYDTFSAYTTDSRKADGWCFDVNGCTDRIYYVKRLNEHAVLESSTYTRELASVFVYPEQLGSMTVRLVDQSGEIVYSSETSEIGQSLPTEIADELSKGSTNAGSSVGFNRSVISERYLINTNECCNGWQVICSVPTEDILQDNIRMRSFTLKVSVEVALFFALVGLGILLRIYRPMEGMVSSLRKKAEIDKLSGVLNKAAFQDDVEGKLAGKGKNDLSILVMIDMDNFKQINDKLGHSHGDQVIVRMGRLLAKTYDSDALVGRLGGDEFSVYSECILSSDDMDDAAYASYREDMIKVAKQQLVKLMQDFEREFSEERKTCNISLSAGVYVTDRGAEESFKIIFDKADKALYASKRAGKSRYTIYTEGEGEHEAH